jgi:hypothetical protein
MAERDGGGRSEGEPETEDSTEVLGSSLEGTEGRIELWEVAVFNLLDAGCFLRKGILSFVLEVLAPLEEDSG